MGTLALRRTLSCHASGNWAARSCFRRTKRSAVPARLPKRAAFYCSHAGKYFKWGRDNGIKSEDCSERIVAMTGLDAVRKFHLFLLVGLFIFCIPGISAQRPEEQFPAIVSALQNQQFDEALALILPALKAAPGNAQLWAMRGAAYRGKGNTKDALESFRHALKISPHYMPALEAAIQIEFEAGNPAAIPLLERVLRSRPNDLTSHAMLAVLEYQQKNCSAAVPHFEKAESLLESKSPAMHAYAVCLVKEKQYNRALKIFQHSLALNPDDEKERRLLASVELMAKEPNYALTTLQPLLQKSSPDIETLELA